MTDAVVVGSGPNGLAAALTLAEAGVSVSVLEREGELGGGARSAELTRPGLIHDICSAAHPLAVDTPFSRRFDLTAHGLRWRWPEIQYAHPLDGGRGAAAYRSVEETGAALGGRDGRRWESIFGALAERFDDITSDFLKPMLRLPSHPIKLARFGAFSALPANLLAEAWNGAEAQALFAGVAAHAFRPFGTLMSSAIGIALGTAAHRYGWPVAEGGTVAISRAMIILCKRYGVAFETGVHVRSIEELGSPDIVMLDVAPAAAAEICGERIPGRVASALRRYRHGPAAVKVEFAIDGGVPWTHEASRAAGTVHVGGSLEEIADAEGRVAKGEMPARPFVLVCQQFLADPSRSQGDVHPLYAYAHVPRGFQGDAATSIEAQIERFAPGFRDRILARHIQDVPYWERHNPNFVGGDIVTGSNDALQMILRPRPALDPYHLGAPGLFICSAATPPGAGAHGMCGLNAADSALRRL